MKLENQVCSLELSKKLKELGVKQESLWWWANENLFEKEKVNTTLCSSAFIAAELGEILPDTHFNFYKVSIGYRFTIENREPVERFEANARAKMLIWLIENKKIK